MGRVLNLRNIDLNLLPVLDTLLQEECVTRASRRLHLSQSATSSALKRLRDTFDDPILIRDGKRMKTSPKARQIRDSLKQHLDSLATIVSAIAPVEMVETNVEVNISAPEYVMVTMSKLVEGVLCNNAKKIKLKIVKFSRHDVKDQLDKNEIEFAIGGFGKLDSRFKRQRLYTEELVVVMRPDHPAIGRAVDGRMSMKCFAEYEHLVISEVDVLEDAWISKFLNIKGIVREVNTVLPSLSLILPVLNNTDLICVGTKRSVHHAARMNELATLLTPAELGLCSYDIELVWNSKLDDDDMLAMIKNEIVSVAQDLDVVEIIPSEVFA